MTERRLHSTVRIDGRALAALRLVVALLWLYEGLYLKVIAPSAHELQIVTEVVGGSGISPRAFMAVIGAGETLLALGVLSGLFFRPLAVFQIVLLLAMNGSGIAFGNGSITEPLSLLVHNLPFLACIALIGVYGPGAYSLTSSQRRGH